MKGIKRKTSLGKKSAHRSQEKLSSERTAIIARWQRLLNHLVAMVQRHPILVWSGAWITMMALCWISVAGLMHVDTFEVEQHQIAADESRIPPLKPRLQAKPASSFGLLAAIVVSCGATSLLLAKQFTPKESQRRLVVKRSTSVVSTEMAIRQPSNIRSDLPRQGSALAMTQRSIPVTTQPTVTVLSPEENHPLDWGDASLADLMDIRNQKLSNYP